MDRIVAYCGLVCSACRGYIATQANDLVALEALAAEAREQFGVADANAESVRCDGCLGEEGHKIAYCAECEVRACGVERGVANCAYCDDYEGCGTLAGFLEHVTGARETLDAIRSAR
ncbi:MAG TPA: DUF3795 domain-containing protein [Chloroflexi bacterium]|jgi:hypothetical protein|nr:DUF3795 domain-containing protein [Chloroflexota bacterium]